MGANDPTLGRNADVLGRRQDCQTPEKHSRRFVKVVFIVPIQLDLTEDGVDDMRLGDRVVVHNWLGIEKEAV
jgi:hypothetical protein